MDKLKLNLDGNVVEVAMDDNGRYSLNDLFRASGSGSLEKKKPYRFLSDKDRGVKVLKTWENPTSEDFLTCENFDSYVIQTKINRATVTFAPLPIVYKYAAFISEEFEDAVYRSFTALAKGETQEASEIMESVTISPELINKAEKMRKKMNEMVKERFPDAKPFVYGNFNRLVSKGATGFTPKELTGGGKSSVEYMAGKNNEPALSAQIAAYEIAIRMLVIPTISYHDIAVVLGVETTKNKAQLRRTSI